VVQKELDTLAEELKVLRQRAKLANLYHCWMEEFDNLKMEHALMKVEFLIYQKRNKRSQVEQWELYKKQITEIIQEAFKS
jgi:DNA repair ATPase RecN